MVRFQPPTGWFPLSLYRTKIRKAPCLPGYISLYYLSYKDNLLTDLHDQKIVYQKLSEKLDSTLREMMKLHDQNWNFIKEATNLLDVLSAAEHFMIYFVQWVKCVSKRCIFEQIRLQINFNRHTCYHCSLTQRIVSAYQRAKQKLTGKLNQSQKDAKFCKTFNIIYIMLKFNLPQRVHRSQ